MQPRDLWGRATRRAATATLGPPAQGAGAADVPCGSCRSLSCQLAAPGQPPRISAGVSAVLLRGLHPQGTRQWPEPSSHRCAAATPRAWSSCRPSCGSRTGTGRRGSRGRPSATTPSAAAAAGAARPRSLRPTATPLASLCPSRTAPCMTAPCRSPPSAARLPLQAVGLHPGSCARGVSPSCHLAWTDLAGMSQHVPWRRSLHPAAGLPLQSPAWPRGCSPRLRRHPPPPAPRHWALSLHLPNGDSRRRHPRRLRPPAARLPAPGTRPPTGGSRRRPPRHLCRLATRRLPRIQPLPKGSSGPHCRTHPWAGKAGPRPSGGSRSSRSNSGAGAGLRTWTSGFSCLGTATLGRRALEVAGVQVACPRCRQCRRQAMAKGICPRASLPCRRLVGTRRHPRP